MASFKMTLDFESECSDLFLLRQIIYYCPRVMNKCGLTDCVNTATIFRV
jgi:hypothetical protein